MSCWTTACARRREFTLFAASRSVSSSNTAGWRSYGPSRTVTTTIHCSRIFDDTFQPTMGRMHCCFISAAASAYEVIVLESNMVSHICVTIKASEPAERERSGNWKMLTVSFTQSGSSVKKWSSRRRTATVCVTRGALHLRAWALSLHAISKAGRAFSFVRRAKVFHV